MKVLRVAVPYPNHSDITVPCKESLSKLIDASKQGLLPFHLQLKTAQCSRVSLGRNDLINDGKSYKVHQNEFDYDRILFIDADQSFEVENVVRLWEMYDRVLPQYPCVVAGVTCPRGFPNKYNAGLFSENGHTTPMDLMMDSEPEYNYISDMDWCGGAFVMIDTSILSAINYPWFYEEYIVVGDDVHSIGEDVMFCRKLKDAGMHVFVDGSNYIVHHCDNIIPPAKQIPPSIQDWYERSSKMMSEYLSMTKAQMEEIAKN